MQKQDLIHEVFWLRSIACLAVTLGHAISTAYLVYPESTKYNAVTYVLSIAVLFGVPVFVFISEFLLANKYHIKVPEGFMKKRIKVLLLPYLFMGTVYTFINMDTWTFKSFVITEFSSIFLGKSAVYFILIIFQFYLLHTLFSKHLNHLSAKLVIPIAFIMNFLYLAFFNFIESPNNAIAQYVWDVGYWLPFLGWLFYFVLGFYIGKNYQSVIYYLQNRWLLLIPVLALIIMLVLNKYFLIDQDSKRVDMLLYATSIIVVIMSISSRLKRIPRVVMFISNYSFSIFLLNMLFFVWIGMLKPPSFMNILTYSLVIFVLNLILSIGTAYLLNQSRAGKYLVGRIMTFKAKSKPVKSDCDLPYVSSVKDIK